MITSEISGSFLKYQKLNGMKRSRRIEVVFGHLFLAFYSKLTLYVTKSKFAKRLAGCQHIHLFYEEKFINSVYWRQFSWFFGVIFSDTKKNI